MVDDGTTNKLLLTMNEFMALTGMRPTKSWECAHVGTLPTVRVGRRVYVARDVAYRIARGEIDLNAVPSCASTRAA